MTSTAGRDAFARGLLLAGGAALLVILGACAADPAPTLAQPAPVTSRPAPTIPAPTPTTPAPTPRRSMTEPAPTLTPPTARAPRGRPSGEPERVLVRSRRGDELVDAALVRTGLDDQGVLAPAPGVAGWYDEAGWPKPGFPGASILAGHINTRRNGPDTFAHLPEVRPGAVVTVRYSSGDEVDFVVTRSKAVPKTQTPKDDSIWDAGNPRPLLRLITCDPTTPVKGGHYVGNWVVWASPPA